MEINLNSESRAARVIVAMAHPAGTAQTYLNTLSRIFNAVLYTSDDLGMDDTEAMETLRVLSLLRSDIEDIAADKTLGEAIRDAHSPEHVQTDQEEYPADNCDDDAE